MSHLSPLPPIETRALQVAKKCKIYRNGDPHFSRTFTLDNRRVRTFDAFLTGLSNDLKLRNGAVRKLVTPVHGHRVRDLADIEDGKVYVATGSEPFRTIGYTQIEPPRRKPRHHNRDERVVPVHHNKYLENVSAKIHQIPIQGKAIDVVVNGQFLEGATKVCLLPHQQSNMYEARKAIAEKVAEWYNYRCDEICDLDGHVLTDPSQLESGGLYVAKNMHHRFQRGKYHPHGLKNIIVPHSPRDEVLQRKYLWKDKSTMNGHSSDYRRPRTLPPINSKKHSPDHSVSSYPETRKRNQVNGVPMKPAKHTKKTHKTADYDKDDGGVFKAKGQNKDTRGAREVRDTGDTKVDLPIDQVRAEEVKDEELFNDETETKVPSGVTLSRQPSDWSDTQDEKIKKEKQGKEVNKTAKQPDHSHSKTIQNGDRSKMNGEPSHSKNNSNNNAQSKTAQNSTYKSNSKAPPPVQSQNKNNVKENDAKKSEPPKQKNDPKNDVKKNDPPKQNDRNFNNHDPVRSSTPKDDKKDASPSKTTPSPIKDNPPSKTTPSPTKDNKVSTPAEEHQAATKIQANFRGHQARKEVNDLKKKKEVNDQKKLDDAQKAKQTKEEHEAATKIQAGFRGHQARKEVNAKKQVRDLRNNKEDAAATKIQAGFRGHQARKEVAAKKDNRSKQQTEEDVAATKIQAGFRGHQARKEINQKKQVRSDKMSEEEQAATKIQAGFRGHQARKEVELKKKDKAEREEEEKAATKIQASFRGHQARKDVKKKKNIKLDGKVDAITVIQAAARGFLVRRRIQKRESTKMLLKLRSAAQEEVMDILGLIHERDKAATTIQTRYRGYRDRKEYEKMKVKELKKVSATFLQANVRAFLARKDINKHLCKEFRKLDTPVNRQGYYDSVDKLQASFHGYLFRKVAFEKLNQILVRKDEATVLQAAMRAYVERWHIKRRNLAALARYHKASTELQMLFKDFLLKRSKAQEMEKQNTCATKIQASVRAFIARNGYNNHRRAVTRIQSGYRGFKARQQYGHLIRERQNIAATAIQSNFRGYAVRKNILRETRQQAIIQLLASFRGYLDRIEIERRIRLKKKIELENAVLKIQTNFRGYSERQNYQVMKRQKANEKRRMDSATELQSLFHGFLARRKLITAKPKAFDNGENSIGVDNFLQDTVQFDLQTTGHISSRRPRTSRLQRNLSNVSREQTYVINGDLPTNSDASQLKSMTRSTMAHVDSFSHLQDSFRSLLSRRRKSNKPPQQIFHERTRLKALTNIQASFRGFLTRRIIFRMCQFDRQPSSVLSIIPSPSPSNVMLKNPDEIKSSGSYANIKTTGSQDGLSYDFNGEVNSTLVKNPKEMSRALDNNKILEGSKDDNTSTDVPDSTDVDLGDVRHSTPVNDRNPVQYLLRNREASHQSAMIHNRYEEPSPVTKEESYISNPSATNRSRHEEPSPPIQSDQSPVFSHHFGKRRNMISPIQSTNEIQSRSHRFEEPSPSQDIHISRYDEPSPRKNDETLNKPAVQSETYRIPDNKTNRNVYEEPSVLQTDQSNADLNAHGEAESRNWRESELNLATYEEQPDRHDTNDPASSRDTVHDLPQFKQTMREPSNTTNTSSEDEISMETFSRNLVNEIHSNTLLRDEALLILQAAFKGFLLRNRSHSKHFKKLSRMDVDDMTMFDQTALPFLQAGIKGYLTQNSDTVSPVEM